MVTQEQKIRIKLKAYSYHLLNQACQQIISAANLAKSKVVGPIPLPTRRKIYCVLRSPHVDKDSREHFEMRLHYRILDVIYPSLETIDALIKLKLPFGVEIEVKL
uniref:30S ribosomal protein S10, chloroplastic n=1 Tax=Apophlaea sinclairii TaxID=212746 RepID=A0A1C9CBT8_9FLOR|nr:ribosomal protein S10 [Apophlaea sinclairii]AOM65851.1 ribosomal protein S10 [Apophlaea sinclairii]